MLYADGNTLLKYCVVFQCKTLFSMFFFLIGIFVALGLSYLMFLTQFCLVFHEVLHIIYSFKYAGVFWASIDYYQ